MAKSAYMEIIQRIASIREEKGISKKEVAQHLGIAERTYYYIENGSGNLDLKRLIAICACLGITLEDLLSGNKEKGETSLVVYDSNDVSGSLDTIAKELAEKKERDTEILSKLDDISKKLGL